MFEVKETVYIAISAILLALVLGLASVLINIRNDIASARNEEILSAQDMVQYRQFNKYNDKVISGDDVIELIRLYYTEGIDIYINSKDGTPGAIRINASTLQANPALVSLDYLQSSFPNNRTYRAQVVYNAINPQNVTGPMTKIAGSEVTGISIHWVSNN